MRFTEEGASCDKPVTDHALPVDEIVNLLLDLHDKDLDLTPENLNTNVRRVDSLLQRSILLMCISKDEDKLLRLHKVWKCMPPEYRQPGHPWHHDVFCRYKKAGIPH